MAEELAAITLKNVRAPQMTPGMISGEMQMEDLLGRLADNFTNIQNTINNLTVTVNNNVINIATGGMPNDCWNIGSTFYPVAAVSPRPVTGGNRTIQLMANGQLVAGWITNTSPFYYHFKKSAAPYVQWTNLSGASRDATTFTDATLNAVEVPCFTQDSDTGDIIAFYKNFAGTNQCYAATFADNGDGTWDDVPTLSALFGSDHSFLTGGCAISTSAGVLMARGNSSGGFTASVYFKTHGSPTWGRKACYRRYNDSGVTRNFTGGQSANTQLLNLGDQRILFLWQEANNIFWTMSVDDGVTFPFGGGTVDNSILGAAGQIGGVMLGTFADFTTNANVDYMVPGRYRSWVGAWNAATARVGFLYSGRTVGAGVTGIHYCEFDPDLKTWTTQADHVIVSRHRDGGGASGAVENSGMALCVSDGVTRAFWLAKTYSVTAGSNPIRGIAYARAVDGGNPLTVTDWQDVREFVIPVQGKQTASTVDAAAGEFMGLPSGILAVNSVNCYPVSWTNGTDEPAYGVPSWDINIKMIPIAAIDAIP